jgi:hypothetical protein
MVSKKYVLTPLILFIFMKCAWSFSENIQGHFGGMSNQLSSDIGDVPGNRFNADFKFSYERSVPYEIERKFEFAALVNDQGLAMFSLPEAYVGFQGIFRPALTPNGKSGDKVKLGRQILAWSQVDRLWGFGKLNNRRNFDFFDPGQEGLIGVGYENRSSSGFFWRAFGSGLYVPELNPGLDIDKKKRTITSRNPWADAPAPSTVISGNETPIEYIVNYPEISDIVFRYSAGLNAGWENKHWALDGFFIRKPENQLSTLVEIAVASNADSVKAFINPEFYYHDLYGGNLKYRNADLEIYISGIAIRPNTYPDGDQTATRYTEIKTEKRREDYVGGGISLVNDRFGVGANYVARLSPFNRDSDSLAADPRWNQAVNTFIMKTLGRSIKLSADFKYDTLTTDRLFMFRADYKAAKQLLVSAGVNVIGTPADGKSFWSPFTNNDALLAAMRYTF